MKCPKCKNTGFIPTEDVSSPIKNLGKKEHYDKFDLRRYACLQCGYSWITKEEYYRDVQIQRNYDLFDSPVTERSRSVRGKERDINRKAS